MISPSAQPTSLLPPDSGLASHRNRPVIITMIPMWMMQVAVNQVVDVTAMGNALMFTARAMYMTLLMSSTLVTRRTSLWIRRRDFKNVLVNAIGVCVLQVAILQVVGVTGVNDGYMAAGESVLMNILLMIGAFAHRDPPGCKGSVVRLTVDTQYACAASRTIPITLIRRFL
jgi:hypothetical protein